MGSSSSKFQGLKRWRQVFEPAALTDTNQRAIRYALAILAAIAALLLRKALVPVLGENNPFRIAWLAVVFSAWYCGFWQSVIALMIETLGVWYWLIPPFNSFRIQNRANIDDLLSFVFVGTFIIALGESYRRTAARRAAAEEQARRAAEVARGAARFRALLESAPDAIVVTDKDGKIIFVNSQTQKAFGYGRDELMGREFEILMPVRFRNHDLEPGKDLVSEPYFRAMDEDVELYGLHRWRDELGH